MLLGFVAIENKDSPLFCFEWSINSAFFNIFLAIKYTYCIYGLVSPSNDIASFKLNTISFSLGLFKQVNINAPIAIFLAASSLFTKL